MVNLRKIGRLFFGVGIIAYGIQQIVIQDFRPQIVPGFPDWAHTITALPIVMGVVLVLLGLMLSGLIAVRDDLKRVIALCLGFSFLVLIFLSHIPYLLFVYPHKLSHLGSWGDALKELAFSGGGLIVAGSFSATPAALDHRGAFLSSLEKLIPFGRLFFCTTIILFGCNHFAYDLSPMVPTWFGMPMFWSYFAGAALVGAGLAMLFKFFLRPVALLLALMLFLWFIFLHVPNAIADPYVGRGNRIVSAFDALLFCGTALILAQSKIQTSEGVSAFVWAGDARKRRSIGI